MRAEFESIRDTVGLILADVGAPLANLGWVSDAEGGEDNLAAMRRGRRPNIIDPGGHGIVARILPPNEFYNVARRADMRGCAITEEERGEILVDPEKEKGKMAERTHLPPDWYMQQREWLELDGGTLRRKDHINLGEARGTLGRVRIAACSPSFHRACHLVLADSKVVVGSFSKCRSPSRR